MKIKSHFLTLILGAAVLMGLGACKSQKQPTAPSVIPSQPEQTATWQNVELPVKIEMMSPKQITLNGRATLVRDKYVLITIKMLFFEVGTIYADPQNVEVVLNQPSKIWIEQPIAEHFKKLKIDFATLQEALLGDQTAIDRIPLHDGLGIVASGTERRPVVTAAIKTSKRSMEGRLTWMMDQADWNVASPAAFSQPSSGYTRMTVQQLMQKLGK